MKTILSFLGLLVYMSILFEYAGHITAYLDWSQSLINKIIFGVNARAVK